MELIVRFALQGVDGGIHRRRLLIRRGLAPLAQHVGNLRDVLLIEQSASIGAPLRSGLAMVATAG